MIITRWIWGPTETVDEKPQPICREYATRWFAPDTIVNDMCLTECDMTPIMYEAAQQDTTITILPSIHSSKPIPATIASALAAYGITATMTVGDLLEELGQKCSHRFLPNI